MIYILNNGCFNLNPLLRFAKAMRQRRKGYNCFIISLRRLALLFTLIPHVKLNKPRIAQIHTNKYSPKLVNKIRVIRAIRGQNKKHLRILGFKEVSPSASLWRLKDWEVKTQNLTALPFVESERFSPWNPLMTNGYTNSKFLSYKDLLYLKTTLT